MELTKWQSGAEFIDEVRGDGIPSGERREKRLVDGWAICLLFNALITIS
jgi:hypothetical protein